MAKAKIINKDGANGATPPALTVEAKENQMISLAMDLAEKRLREGTASSGEVVHFLKLGSLKQRLESDKLKEEVKLTKAKTEVLAQEKKMEQMYSELIEAMKLYSGQETYEEVDFE